MFQAEQNNSQLPLLNPYGKPNSLTVVIMKLFSPVQGLPYQLGHCINHVHVVIHYFRYQLLFKGWFYLGTHSGTWRRWYTWSIVLSWVRIGYRIFITLTYLFIFWQWFVQWFADRLLGLAGDIGSSLRLVDWGGLWLAIDLRRDWLVDWCCLRCLRENSFRNRGENSWIWSTDPQSNKRWWHSK